MAEATTTTTVGTGAPVDQAAMGHTAPAAGTVATVEQPHGAAHPQPELWGLAPFQVVALAMAVLIAIMLWKKVPQMVVSGLDNKIAAIRQQLDEARQLRAEAEALRQEYQTKIANAEKDAAAMLDTARKEADGILAKAEEDGAAMIARRQRMAEDKIAAAERSAVEEVRQRAATAAAAASKQLIAAYHGADADRSLADRVIAGI